MSVPPPAEKPTTILTGFEGYDPWAPAIAAPEASVKAAITQRSYFVSFHLFLRKIFDFFEFNY